MTTHAFTSEQRDFVDAVRDFCRRECGTREKREALTDGWEEQHNAELYAKLAEVGYVGVSIPEEYGGSGGGLVEQVLVFEELWRGLAPVHGMGPSHTVAGVYKRFGSETQKARALGAICEGKVYSISISEPEAGSDAAAITCQADRVDGGYRINGQKTWCSDAQHAAALLLVARTSREDRRHDGFTMFEIPTDAPGLVIRPISTLGGSEVNDIFFDDVFVPDEAVVGTVGGAWHQLMACLNGERIVCAAQQLGLAQRTLDDLLEYVRDRRQFGAPVGSFQAVSHRIADLAIEVEATRALVHDVTQRVAAGVGTENERVRATSIAKVKSTETAKRVALEGVQLMGGYGYSMEFEMQRHLRLSIAPTIYAGTNEIQRDIIAGTLGLRNR